jgi:hypothetical protein
MFQGLCVPKKLGSGWRLVNRFVTGLVLRCKLRRCFVQIAVATKDYWVVKGNPKGIGHDSLDYSDWLLPGLAVCSGRDFLRILIIRDEKTV